MARSYDSGFHQARSIAHADDSFAHPSNPPPELAAPPPSKMSKMGLHQIVRLRQMVMQWRRRAASNIDRTFHSLSPRGAGGRKLIRGGSSSSGRSLSSSSSSSSSAAMGSAASESHHRDLPPEGYLAIYVGRERRRFEIRTEHINHPLLRGLLERTEEEFGLNQQGGLAIPACEVVLFEHMLWMMENQDMAHLFDSPSELRELLDFYMHASTSTSCMQEANLREAATTTSAMSSAGFGTLHH